jgi:hypothetical protein
VATGAQPRIEIFLPRLGSQKVMQNHATIVVFPSLLFPFKAVSKFGTFFNHNA